MVRGRKKSQQYVTVRPIFCRGFRGTKVTLCGEDSWPHSMDKEATSVTFLSCSMRNGPKGPWRTVTGIVLSARLRHVIFALVEVALSMRFFPAGHTARYWSCTRGKTASDELMLRLEAACIVVVIHVAQTTPRAIAVIGYMHVHLSAQQEAFRATKTCSALFVAFAAFLK